MEQLKLAESGDYICRCNYCDNYLINHNPQSDAKKYDTSITIGELIQLKDDGGIFWGCPFCKTDNFLMDVSCKLKMMQSQEEKKLNEILYYQLIIYLEGYETEETFNILKEKGEVEAMNYLLQWDYGEYQGTNETNPNLPYYTNAVSECGNYLLVYNTNLESLCFYFIVREE